MAFKQDQELQAAIQSGWKPYDLRWERFQEKGNMRLEEDRFASATVNFLMARILAGMFFQSTDLRFLTSQSNITFILNRLGYRKMACRNYRRLENRWKELGKFDHKDLEIKPRGRSSLFHVRMEALHWEQYRQNVTSRLQKFAEETGQCLGCFAREQEISHRLFSRWKGEKYPIFDDTRKILGACLLVAGGR
ncbi:MAG: hypothetical protein F4Z09_00770 [Rhodobacteraceae bacterium]|nr:hypothetical protein [Paracoccaceae bacterium]MYF45286.1 hypothetical protein [Paracoccaceae bacterium]